MAANEGTADGCDVYCALYSILKHYSTEQCNSVECSIYQVEEEREKREDGAAARLAPPL